MVTSRTNDLKWRALIPVLLLLACGGNPQPQAPAPTGLTGVNWRLVTLGELSPVQSSTGVDLSLLLTDNREASGYSGCNKFQSSYTRNGDSLRFGPLAGTRAACVGSQRLEQKYLEVLAATSRFQVTPDSLTLFQGDAPIAVFKR